MGVWGEQDRIMEAEYYQNVLDKYMKGLEKPIIIDN